MSPEDGRVVSHCVGTQREAGTVSNREALLRALREQALDIRRNTWRALRAAGSGHMGGSLSAADLLAALYFHYLISPTRRSRLA